MAVNMWKDGVKDFIIINSNLANKSHSRTRRKAQQFPDWPHHFFYKKAYN
jgi:hypothetical protein